MLMMVGVPLLNAEPNIIGQVKGNGTVTIEDPTGNWNVTGIFIENDAYCLNAPWEFESTGTIDDVEAIDENGYKIDPGKSSWKIFDSNGKPIYEGEATYFKIDLENADAVKKTAPVIITLNSIELGEIQMVYEGHINNLLLPLPFTFEGDLVSSSPIDDSLCTANIENQTPATAGGEEEESILDEGSGGGGCFIVTIKNKP